MNKDFWKALGIRCIRTFLTTILGVWTAGTLITEIDWKTTFISAFSATVYIVLLSIVSGLPEVKLEKTLYDLDNIADEDYAIEYEELEDQEWDEEGDE